MFGGRIQLPAPGRAVDYGWRLALLTAALYLPTLVAVWAQSEYQVGPIWPLTGLGFAAMWLAGLRWWPAVFLGQTAMSLTLGMNLPLSLAAGWVETLAALLMLAGVQRYQITPDFGHVRNVVRYLGMSLAVSLVPAFLFLTIMLMLGRTLLEGPFGAWGFYWLGEVLSFVLFTPAVVVLVQDWRSGRFEAKRLLTGLAPLAAAALLLPLAEQSLRDPLFYVLLPLAVFASAYAGLAGAVLASLFMVLAMLAVSWLGHHDLLTAWVMAAFVAATAVTGQMLAAMARERRRVEAKLAYQAHHDPLTGLANRFRFEQQLRAFVYGDTGPVHACLYLDLNQFRLLNDACGHAAGDRLLEALAGELAPMVPEGGVAARLGGDEFGVLLPDCPEERARDMARRIGAAFDGYEFDAGGTTFRIGVSTGITLLACGRGDTPDAVLGRAHVACGMAKNGRGVHFYRADDENMLRRHAAIRTISELRGAWQSGRLSVHAQRIVRVDGRHEARHRLELLLRMEGSAPAEFLPLADHYGMMRHVDEWVLGEAGRVLAEHPELVLSVNISSRTVDSAGFHDSVIELRDRHGFDPGQLCLEITETAALENLLQAVRQLRALRAAGFRLALDDFGAGVASFGYLQQLPVSEVKLDGRFVRDLTNNPSSRIIVRSLVDLANIRGIACIAEGVQSPNVLADLRRLGVTHGQGFAIHRPEPIAAALAGLEVEPRLSATRS